MRICFFGDSFVAGTGDPNCLGWVGRVWGAAANRGVDLTCYNLGVRCDTSADIARRWKDEACRRLPPDSDGRLVFSFGVNDCVVEGGAARVCLRDTLAHSRTMVSEACRWASTLFVGPPPVADERTNGRIGELSDALAALCQLLGCPYLDVFHLLAGSSAWMSEVAAGDGAHPGARGYDILAHHIDDWSEWRHLLVAR